MTRVFLWMHRTKGKLTAGFFIHIINIDEIGSVLPSGKLILTGTLRCFMNGCIILILHLFWKLNLSIPTFKEWLHNSIEAEHKDVFISTLNGTPVCYLIAYSIKDEPICL
jgi:hypothetical protein